MKKTFFMLLGAVIFLTGCTMTPPSPTPSQVAEEDGTGAVGTDLVVDAQAPQPSVPQTITAKGTEPFWSFTVSGATLTWMQPENDGTISNTTYPVTVTTSGSQLTITGTGVQGTMTLQPCSDGMSDIAYTYSVAVTLGTTVYNGCGDVN